MTHQQLNTRQLAILNYLTTTDNASALQILNFLSTGGSEVAKITINRDLDDLINQHLIARDGKGKATVYRIKTAARINLPVDSDSYFALDQDVRNAKTKFDFAVFELLADTNLLSATELAELMTLKQEYQANIAALSQTIIERETERVTIELSWKSSAIEGNTYTLLETEMLLREGIEAKGKKHEEAVMLLNHKEAIKYVLNNPDVYTNITIAKIEQLHSILVKDLNITNNIRSSLVGITGTNYKPLDNEFQIREALEKMCALINSKSDVFTKALLSLLLLSYIQPFEDGNKRTSRILANAILFAEGAFMLPMRGVDETAYKQAVLLFYEQNNSYLFKQLFLDQAKASVANYFRVKSAP